jgi:carboxyl-terminal processing protease
MPTTTRLRHLAAALFILFVLTVPAPRASAAPNDDLYAKIKILTQVLYEVQERYVEEVKADVLLDGAIKGMVRTLDPHSSYMTPEEMKELQIDTQGSFSGVGIELTLKDGALTVVAPIDGTPAFRAGIQSRDVIVKINGKSSKDMGLPEAVKLIRGERGTTVVLTVTRENESKPLEVSIVRDVIPMRSVRSEAIEDGYRYIRISNFQANTLADMKEALEKFQAGPTPAKGLVLDLRSNPGGLLDQAVKIADLFLKEGLIVYTQGRNEQQNMKFTAQPSVLVGNYPIVVLVNEGSASAAEILAGALQDHKRALLLGAKTFGKASVQTIIPFRDGSGLRLTTARYYTPSGRSIQASGIEPDIQVPSNFKGKIIREKDLAKHLKGENEGDEETAQEAEAKPEEPAKKPKTPAKPEPEQKPVWEMTPKERFAVDAQLKKAFEMLKNGEVPPLLKAAKTAKAAK